MLIKTVRSKAPLRLGLAGGGTDVSPYCELHTGLILNTTIDKFVHCTLESNQSRTIEFHSSELNESSYFSIQPYLAFDGHMDLYKAIYNKIVSEFTIDISGLKIITYSEAPRGSGLGGSSTLIVAVIKAFCECFELALGLYDIARLAYTIERQDLAWTGGKQDQYAATFGGFNFMEFSDNNIVAVNPLDIKRSVINELEACSLIGFTGISRDSSKIINDQSTASSSNLVNQVNALHQIKNDAKEMKTALLKGDLTSMASILNKSWEAKKQTSNLVSNKHLDEIIKFAKENGAHACKVSGAGGGGFIYFMTEPTNRFKLIEKMNGNGINLYSIRFIRQGTHSWCV